MSVKASTRLTFTCFSIRTNQNKIMSLFNIRKSVVVCCILLLPAVLLWAQKKSPGPSIKQIPMTAEYWEFQPGKAEFTQHKNVPVMKLQRDAGMAIVKN